MNRQELLKKVVYLEQKYGASSLGEETFPFLPGNDQVLSEFKRNKLAGEKWGYSKFCRKKEATATAAIWLPSSLKCRSTG